MQNPLEKIITLLDSSHIKYQLVSHKAVYTSVDAAAIRGLSLHEGAKSLLLNGDDTFLMAIIPGDKRLDTKKLKQIADIKNLRFATPEEVTRVMGCEIGACYPFVTIIDMKPFVDHTLSENEYISFNPGVHDKSIRMKWSDFKSLVEPTMVNIIQK